MREGSCRITLRRKISEKGMSAPWKGRKKKQKRASEEAKIVQQREIELAKVETEKAKVAAEKVKVAADEAKLAQQREIELAKVVAEEAKEKAKIAQQSEIELERVEAKVRICAERPKDWDKYLIALLFAIRRVPQESLWFSPFELLYGRSV